MFCEACDYQTDRKYNFRNHLYTKKHLLRQQEYQKEHGKKFNYQCSKCKITFKHPYTYEEHINRETCKRNTTWKCSRCNFKFTNSKSYYLHMKRNTCLEKLEYKWKCELCENRYKHKSSYYHHRQDCYKKHNRELPKRKQTKWVCDICNIKTYKHKPSYLRHKKICIQNQTENTEPIENKEAIETDDIIIQE